jgi:aspartyl-tRNA(Asn)/glutamyl-tRNA(Gln) amidotransferase subunit B
MRSKEDAHDYRYFPDPDLPPLVIGPEWVESVRKEMPELPVAMAERFRRDYGLSEYDAGAMTQGKAFASFFEAAAKASGEPKLVANWLMGEVSRRLNAENLPIEDSALDPIAFARMISRVADGTISNNAAKEVFNSIWMATAGRKSAADAAGLQALDGIDVDSIIEAKGLRQVSDTGALEKIIDEILAKNPAQAAEYRSGKEKLFGFFVGQAMKATQGKANPQQLNELLKRKLSA